MAEQKMDPRDASWRRLFPWTEIFNGFKLTLDPNKLFLAAVGILLMALAWWILAVVFGALYSPKPEKWTGSTEPDAWNRFVIQRDGWNLMRAAAGIGGPEAIVLPENVAQSPAEYDLLIKIATPRPSDAPYTREGLRQKLVAVGIDTDRAQVLSAKLFQPLPGGLMATWPWFESRGPNPYLMVTGQSGKPWETGHFWEWFAFEQAPVLVEPLVKLLRPIVYLLHPGADLIMRVYCSLVLLATLTIWSVYGGAIARITVMYQTRKEQIDAFEALRFSRRRWLSYIGAPLFPLGITLVCLLVGIVLGWFYLIPYVGDILVAGLGWFLFVALGAAMAVLLIGLVSWPMMPATISTEGRDAWEAFSRSYSYLFSKPWQYIWYALVAIAYGAVLIFFVNFLGSFALYMSKWTLMSTPGISYVNREPHFLFIYAPTTFGYRDLLLEGAVVKMADSATGKDENQRVVRNGRIDPTAYREFVNGLNFNNKAGAVLVSFWLGVLLLVIVGFGYAYFWTASTLIYLLLRRQIDTAEVDEVYLDDEDSYKPVATPVTTPRLAATPTVSPAIPTRPISTPAPQMVDPPTLKTPTPVVSTPTPTPAPTPAPAPAPTPEPPASQLPTSGTTETERKLDDEDEKTGPDLL